MSANRPVTVAVFIDALGSDVAEHHAFLGDAPGESIRLETVIGYSSAAIPSLLTGRLPRVHGQFSMYQRDSGGGIFRPFRALCEIAHRTRGRGVLRRVLKRYVDRRIGGYAELYDIPLDVLSRFDLPQRRDIFAPGGVPPCETFIDRAHRMGVRYRVWTWRDEESSAFRELLTELSSGAGGFYLLYSSALDALMHRVGVRDARVLAVLEEWEERLAAIRRAASGSELRLYVFSDHGMTDVIGVHDVHRALELTGLRVPRDYLVFTDSTMARFWFRDDGHRARVRDALGGAKWGRWLREEEIVRYGIDFADDRFGEEIFLLDAGHLIAPSFMGANAVSAMHGYGPEHASADAWLHAEPPPVREMRSILDLHTLFADEVDRIAAAGARR